MVLPGERPEDLRWILPEALVERSRNESGPRMKSRGEITSFGSLPWPAWLLAARLESARELVLTVADGSNWADHGDEAWAFVLNALDARDGWRIAQAASSEPSAADERLCAAVCGVLDGEFGQYVASHGGRVELVDVCDGVVRVRMSGTCSSCSLADVTLKLRLERDVRVAAGPDFAALETV